MENLSLILWATGSLAAVLAALAWYADTRRHRRINLDRVGFMPWMGVFFWSFLASVLLLGFAVRQSLVG
ncbi:hypothetical protein GR702_03645 [Novosphingobium sp. FGD1]|jgi:hypothetical protein|uniref:Uncharacterized protein n=1 Tax=Novosphingobium silvae TaxID=2692619 RepID=A0A7X4GDZ2_9SPHN|nr:hypothetical protein [Novosphingobium silvae]MYL96868.1 hypothetical protein [Novosphingobium silvae]